MNKLTHCPEMGNGILLHIMSIDTIKWNMIEKHLVFYIKKIHCYMDRLITTIEGRNLLVHKTKPQY